MEEDMLFLFDEATVAEIPDEFRIEFRIEREVKTSNVFSSSKEARESRRFEFLGFSPFDFILYQELEELDISNEELWTCWRRSSKLWRNPPNRRTLSCSSS